jgi:hypothetical protein
MKLLLRRNQRDGMLGGKPVFQLDIRAELTAEEQAAIQKYKLQNVLLYERKGLKEGHDGYSQLGNALAWRFMNLIIFVRDLEDGKRIECKDIIEMLAAEQQVKEAAETFKTVLEACRQFGGEEVVEFA